MVVVCGALCGWNGLKLKFVPRISHGLIFACAFKRRFPECRSLPDSHPGVSPALASLAARDKFVPRLVLALLHQPAYPIRTVMYFSSYGVLRNNILAKNMTIPVYPKGWKASANFHAYGQACYNKRNGAGEAWHEYDP